MLTQISGTYINYGWSPDGSKIAATGQGVLYLLKSDGSNQFRLSEISGLYSSFSWSPDGTKLIAIGNGRIYMINSDGSGQTEFSDLSKLGKWAQISWHPVANKIFIYDLDNYLYSFDPDGSNFVKLTNLEYRAYIERVTFSSDGTKVVFDATRIDSELGITTEIFIVNTDGSNLRKIYQVFGHRASPEPALSPDGQKIAFSAIRDGDIGADIYLMNPDGTGLVNLTKSTYRKGCHRANWSPDGKKIIFDSFGGLDKLNQLRIINVDGSGETNLSGDRGSDFFSSWSPDGKKILFYITRHTYDDRGHIRFRYGDLYIMNIEGGDVIQLFLQTSNDVWLEPLWAP